MPAHDVEHLVLGDEDVRVRQRLHGAESQQSRISGSGTEEGDVPLFRRGGKGGGAQCARSPIRPAAPCASISEASSRPSAVAASCVSGTGPVVDSCTSVAPSVVPTTPRRRISLTICP